jgi:hypothetical protein
MEKSLLKRAKLTDLRDLDFIKHALYPNYLADYIFEHIDDQVVVDSCKSSKISSGEHIGENNAMQSIYWSGLSQQSKEKGSLISPELVESLLRKR